MKSVAQGYHIFLRDHTASHGWVTAAVADTRKCLGNQVFGVDVLVLAAYGETDTVVVAGVNDGHIHHIQRQALRPSYSIVLAYMAFTRSQSAYS